MGRFSSAINKIEGISPMYLMGGSALAGGALGAYDNNSTTLRGAGAGLLAGGSAIALGVTGINLSRNGWKETNKGGLAGSIIGNGLGLYGAYALYGKN
jgi:hypothetical protein